MAKQSLVAQAQAPNIVPSAFGQTSIEVAGPQFVMSPYVVFAHPMAKTLYPKILSSCPGVEEGDPVLILPEPANPVHLNPYKFYLVHAWQHFSTLDNIGNIVKMTLDAEKARRDKDWKEFIETVVIVQTPTGLVPARCTFKTTKANAAHRGIEARVTAAGADWSKKSPEHAASLAMPEPWMRFTCTVRLKKATGRGSGFNYVAATSVINPTGVADWQALKELFEDEKRAKLCAYVVDQYYQRVNEVKAKES